MLFVELIKNKACEQLNLYLIKIFNDINICKYTKNILIYLNILLIYKKILKYIYIKNVKIVYEIIKKLKKQKKEEKKN